MENYCTMPVYDGNLKRTVDVLLDEEDYARFSGFKWRIDKGGYVRRNKWVDGHTKTLLLHRCILGIEWESAEKKCVDHINGNRLDNRKNNLRIVDYSENALNRHAVLTSTGLLRVSKNGNAFVARTTKDGEHVYIGSFATADQAEAALREYNETGKMPYEKRKSKKVVQKNLNGDVIAVFETCAEASRQTGVCASNIDRIANQCHQRKQAGGFLWEYA